MKKFKSLTVILIVMFLLCALSNTVSAVETITPAGSNTAATPTPQSNSINVVNTNNTTNNTSTYNRTNTTNVATNKTNTSSSIPYAGTDSTVVLFILLLVVSAIFAYKKVSDYNIK